MRITRVLLVWLVLVSSVQAQSTTTKRLQWTQGPDVGQSSITLAQVQSYTYTVGLDALPPLPIMPTCTTQNNAVVCTAPLPTTSFRTLTLTVENAFGSATATLSGTSPSGPMNLSVIVNVTVTSP